MKLLLAATAAAAIYAGASQAAPVPPSSPTDNVLVETVKKGYKGKGSFKGNRGRHLGWYKGRGNPHRYRRGWR